MRAFERITLCLFILVSFSIQVNGQMDIYVQANGLYTNNSDYRYLQWGGEAGVALEKWDIGAVGLRSYRIGRNLIDLIDSSERTILGAVAARKLNLKLFSLRFPLMVGMTGKTSPRDILNVSELIISPGAQVCVGKYRTQVGLGYQYFYSPNAEFDSYNVLNYSAFLRFKLF